ncbi:MAG: Holliday junction ATP-dependent DNA helicase RuvB [candidate division TM6 bacterium GW2011_GWE2_41_16]|nr:MAG: Holliday junction ATP-dependent DNA helicase RuvB [candidate division TM6 bacterium GW2011_GWE2_41_16]
MEFSKSPLYELFSIPDEKNICDEPKSFAEYSGQDALKQKLLLFIQAAKQRDEALDHVLLFGPPGLGKTTLATLIAKELGVNIKTCSGPLLERSGDLVSILTSIKPRDILFIDEIHRMPIAIEEVLYSALERYSIDVILGQGAGAKAITLPLNPFTLIGATTQSGLISAPLRSRFGISEHLDFYDEAALQDIIIKSSSKLNCTITPQGGALLARCCRGTPRIAKKLFRRVRDVAQMTNNNIADEHIVQKTLAILDITSDGLTKIDLRILSILLDHPTPVGLETIACLTGEDKVTIEDVYEPFLIRQGYIEKTPRGRTIAQRERIELYTRRSNEKWM